MSAAVSSGGAQTRPVLASLLQTIQQRHSVVLSYACDSLTFSCTHDAERHTMTRRSALLCLVLLFLVSTAHARQAATPPSGRWMGTLPAGPGLEMEVNLARKGSEWYGTISIPQQGAKGVPLGDVTVKGKAVAFAIKGAPGDPRFSGTLSDDGKTISGDFTQGGGSLQLSLAWKGEAKFEVPPKSTPLTKDFAGTWEGTLDANGTMLRLRLNLTSGSPGTGVLVSLDQGNVEIPISTITQEKTRVKLMLSTISGTFDGDLKGSEIAGTWTQGPLTRPLVFKRTAK
jgi:hypothetical protein